MKKPHIIFILILLLLVGSASATCVRILNPAEKLDYWKLHTYSVYNDVLNYPTIENTWSVSAKPETYQNKFGSGLIYNFVVDYVCEDAFLLTHRGATGASSPFFTITEQDGNYRATTIPGKIYSMSIYNFPIDRSGSQTEISCMIDGINYCQLPDSFQPANFQTKHYWLYNDWNNICDKNLTIEQQLLKIKTKIWNNCALTADSINCGNFESHADCVWANNAGKCQGSTYDYASLFAAMARRCNIPTRFVDGYSEMTEFADGSYRFNGGERHAWVEVFWPKTKYWAEYEVTEDNLGFKKSETQCLDGLDNDGDQNIDCADGDCALLTECTNPLPAEPVVITTPAVVAPAPVEETIAVKNNETAKPSITETIKTKLSFWNKISKNGKIVIGILLAGIIIYLLYRRNQNKKYGYPR